MPPGRKVYKPRSDIEPISAARSSDLLTGGDRAIVRSRMESVLRFAVANRGIWAFQADAKRSVSTCLPLSGTPLIKASNRLSLKMSETLRQQLCWCFPVNENPEWKFYGLRPIRLFER